MAAASVAAVFHGEQFCCGTGAGVPRVIWPPSMAFSALLVNAGNANCGTGQSWRRCSASRPVSAVAGLLNIDVDQVLPFSTGVILEPLPVDRLLQALPDCVASLAVDHWCDAASAIMTTDTVPKAVSAQLDIAGCSISITGIAKGVGMLQPRMATMLAYLATDASIAAPLLQRPCQSGCRPLVQPRHG